uniref:Uncharacterized protein n=1 Tax=Molossus molossus TaxID=27622 RepID=A0A7J8GLM4_MOLMO|nr:hypothetical protein HJG59_011497 [Molossus molossus]
MPPPPFYPPPHISNPFPSFVVYVYLLCTQAYKFCGSSLPLPPTSPLLGFVSLYPTSMSLGQFCSSVWLVHNISQICDICFFSAWLFPLSIILFWSLHVLSNDDIFLSYCYIVFHCVHVPVHLFYPIIY